MMIFTRFVLLFLFFYFLFCFVSRTFQCTTVKGWGGGIALFTSRDSDWFHGAHNQLFIRPPPSTCIQLSPCCVRYNIGGGGFFLHNTTHAVTNFLNGKKKPQKIKRFLKLFRDVLETEFPILSLYVLLFSSCCRKMSVDFFSGRRRDQTTLETILRFLNDEAPEEHRR